MKPEIMIAATYMSVCERKETWLSNRFHSSELLKGKKRSERRLITVLTAITNTSRVLSPGVKHGTDNHKARHEGTFTYSKNKTSGKETSKVLASCMAAQSNSPDEYVQARKLSLLKIELHESECSQPHPFSDREPLQRQILRELEREISEKEYRP